MSTGGSTTSAFRSPPKPRTTVSTNPEGVMNTRTCALAGLVVLAALTRLLPHPENFAPMTAMAVFAAARLGSRRAALLVPLLALLLSDLGKEVLYRNGLARDWGLYRGMW